MKKKKSILQVLFVLMSLATFGQAFASIAIRTPSTEAAATIEAVGNTPTTAKNKAPHKEKSSKPTGSRDSIPEEKEFSVKVNHELVKFCAYISE